MTVLLATRRRDAVVLAADRMWHGLEVGGPARTGTTSKIITHPRLPVAAACGGFLRLPVGGRAVPVAVLVAAVLAGIADPAQLDMVHVLRLLAARLHPPLLTALADPALAGVPEEKKAEVVLVGMVGARAQLGRVLLTQEVAIDPDEAGFVSAPLALRDHFETGADAAGGALFAAGTADPERIAAHFREVIAGAEAEEARRTGGQNREVGGGVDVAVVRADGARLY